MATLSTHVLDTSRGRPAAGVRITLRSAAGDDLAEAVTDADGRAAEIGAGDLAPGEYRLRFDTGAYFTALGTDHFYPAVLVTFVVEGDGHFHVPLLLSPYGYSTYRGS
ncbi:MAG: uraD [Nocardioides sp.]|jgi:5-hydroxyisourate hydrolase|nr:uraD [Nocardioides sp.]